MKQCTLLFSFVFVSGFAQAVYCQSSEPRPPAANAKGTIVAIINGSRVITEREIDASIGPEVYALQQKIHTLRKNAIENLINRLLLEQEANAKGIAVEELRKRLVPDLVEISDADVERAFADHGIEAAAAHGTYGLEETKKAIRQDLEKRAKLERYNASLAELRRAAKVDILLEEPPTSLVSVSDAGPSRGSKDAPVTIIEFSDFQCSSCRQESATLTELLQLYSGKVRLVLKQMPLPTHPQAWQAAQASVCAAAQGKFWEYHDKLFSSTDLSVDALRGYAKQTGLTLEDFDKCLASDTSRAAVLKDVQEARHADVRVTPTFVINGRALTGFTDLETFKREIDRELSKAGRGKW